MTLGELIGQQLSGDEDLSPLLATYNDAPAVFENLAPEDSDEGWDGAQSPRIEFLVNRRYDPKHRVSGQILLFILHQDSSADTIAQIDVEVRRILDGATFRPDEGTMTLQWRAVKPVEDDAEYRGIELVFELFAWPAGTTYDPDPVKALRDWAVAKWPVLQVDPQTWTPSDSAPALYWRPVSIDSAEMEPWGAWMTGRFQGHLLADSPSVRAEWIRRIVEGLALDRRVWMADQVPLTLQSIGADSEADPFRSGQIRVSGRFGVLPSAGSATLLNHATVSGKEGV